MDDIPRMIRERFHKPGTEQAMAQRHNYRGSCDKHFLDYIAEELIKQPNNSFNPLRIFVPTTEASLQFTDVLPMGRSAIASSCRPVPCINSNSNCNCNNITNITSVENTGLVDGSMILEGAMSPWGYEWCQWLDLGFSLCAILFEVSSVNNNSSKCNRTDRWL